MDAKDIALNNLILKCVVGSTAHGLAVKGTDDTDEMGICIPPASHVIGLSKFETYVYRTQPEGVRSGPGDLDLVIHSLKKYVSLALKGNPTVLLPLFVPESSIITCDDLGKELRALAPSIVSKRAGRAFLGYLTHQKKRLFGEAGQKRVNRPELIAKYGYDTKYAMHALRLGYQGLELIETGSLTLPMKESQRETLMKVRTGKISLEKVRQLIEYVELTLETDLPNSSLPDEPDYSLVNSWLVGAHAYYWYLNDIHLDVED